MTESVINFPSQAVSDLEKLSEKYGLDVAKAIKHEWFDGTNNKFHGNINISKYNNKGFTSKLIKDKI